MVLYFFPDFSTQPNCCNGPSVIFSPRKFLVSQFPHELVTYMKRLSEQWYHSKIRDRPTRREGNLGSWAAKFELMFAPCIQAVRLDMRSNRKKRSRLSLTSNSLFTITSVVCAMQTMSGICADTYQCVEEHKRSSSIGNHIKDHMEQTHFIVF